MNPVVMAVVAVLGGVILYALGAAYTASVERKRRASTTWANERLRKQVDRDARELRRLRERVHRLESDSPDPRSRRE